VVSVRAIGPSTDGDKELPLSATEQTSFDRRSSRLLFVDVRTRPVDLRWRALSIGRAGVRVIDDTARGMSE